MASGQINTIEPPIHPPSLEDRKTHLFGIDTSRVHNIGARPESARSSSVAIRKLQSRSIFRARPTVAALTMYLAKVQSPKLRSLRDGLNALGINSEEMLQHGIEKVVYGATLVANASRYLLRLDDVPQYLFSLDKTQASTARIAQYWFDRWASPRMGRSETEQKLLSHTLVRPIRHGARVVLPSNDADQLVFRID